MSNLTMSSIFLSAIVLIVYTASSVSGLSLLKAAPAPVSVPFIAGAALYGAGFLIWIFAILKLMPLSIGFPLASGALIIGTQLSGWLYLKETMSLTHLIGVGLIMAGICLIYMSGETA